MSCAVGCRCSSDLAMLWLQHKLVATAPIQPLAWKLPYAMDAALKKHKEKERKKCPPPLFLTKAINLMRVK